MTLLPLLQCRPPNTPSSYPGSPVYLGLTAIAMVFLLSVSSMLILLIPCSPLIFDPIGPLIRRRTYLPQMILCTCTPFHCSPTTSALPTSPVDSPLTPKTKSCRTWLLKSLYLKGVPRDCHFKAHVTILADGSDPSACPFLTLYL